MKYIVFPVIIAIIVLLILLARLKPEQELVPAGLPMAKWIHFQFAIYYLPVPTNDRPAVLRHRVGAEHKDLTIVDEMPEAPPTAMLVLARIEKKMQQEYACTSSAEMRQI